MAVKNLAAKKAEIVLCPSFTSLAEVGKVIKGSGLKLGSQDCFWESAGAFTGEISVRQIKEVGCEYVILGHSERRTHLGETDEMIHRKAGAVLAADLTPVVCVGETFEQRQEGATDYVLIQQVTKALAGAALLAGQTLVVAYEPVWVIGSGQAIEPAAAAAAHEVIRQTLLDLFGAETVKRQLRVIYGGSVDAGNVGAFVRQENTHGILVGGASLNAETFSEIIKNA